MSGLGMLLLHPSLAELTWCEGRAENQEKLKKYFLSFALLWSSAGGRPQEWTSATLNNLHWIFTYTVHKKYPHTHYYYCLKYSPIDSDALLSSNSFVSGIPEFLVPLWLSVTNLFISLHLWQHLGFVSNLLHSAPLIGSLFTALWPTLH